MMDENKQLAQRINGASQEVTNLRSELTATSSRLAELGATDRERDPFMENHDPQHNHHHVFPVLTLACFWTLYPPA
ncbi:kazrin-A-like [Salvelinus fontinalis]|uniref:kazrin-A-like n=1 Tax=Salvelinus fontinalis TaxID=8038 RepID=UPI0024855B0A|nr:kazrin-A-like [Salvelinus fontinalis]